MDPVEPELFAGIDLAWSSGWTGLAVVDGSGRIVSSGRVRADDEIDAWLQDQPGRLSVVAVDAPLVVPNESGQRAGETEIGRAYSAYGASAHSSNRETFEGQEPRAMALARRFGWAVDPDVVPTSDGPTVCIEVYPHPALVGLYDLPYRLDYKKGSTSRRLPGFLALVEILESIPELGLGSYGRWGDLRRVLEAPSPGDLGRWEDEVDAIVCAHLAWRWLHVPDSLTVYGSLAGGYIVAPPPPTHRPIRPSGVASGATDASAALGEEPLIRGGEPARAASSRARRGRTQSSAERAIGDARALRSLLIARARAGEGSITYGEAAAHVGRIPNGLGPVLDGLEEDCALRGEPNLAVLVVNKTTGVPTKYARLDWRTEQDRCLTHDWLVES